MHSNADMPLKASIARVHTAMQSGYPCAGPLRLFGAVSWFVLEISVSAGALHPTRFQYLASQRSRVLCVSSTSPGAVNTEYGIHLLDS